MLLPGPDNMTMDSIENFMTHVGDKNILIAYIGNQRIRSLDRRIISWTFINTVNLLFGLHLKYYLGVAAYKTELIKNVKKTTNSFALPAEVLIRLIKEGHSYKQVPIYALEIPNNSTNAFRLKNIIGISIVILRLFFEMHFVKNAK